MALTGDISVLGVYADPVESTAGYGSRQVGAGQHLPGTEGEPVPCKQGFAQSIGTTHDLCHIDVKDVREDSKQYSRKSRTQKCQSLALH